MGYYKTEKINDWLYAIYDPGDVYIYVILGNNAAVVYDTGYGTAPIIPTIREITGQDMPLICILGHGHVDHACGAYQFDAAWIYKPDLELCRRHTSRTARKYAINMIAERGGHLPPNFDEETYIHSGVCELKTLEIGQIFDIGGKTIEIINMEGHTHGSIGVLVREERALLTSDASNLQLWLFLEESTSKDTYIAMLKRNLNLDFDTFYIGHDTKPFDKSWFHKFIQVAKNANIAQSVPFPRLPERKGMKYTEGDVSIVISEDKL